MNGDESNLKSEGKICPTPNTECTQTLNIQNTRIHKAHPHYCNQNGTVLIIVLKSIIVFVCRTHKVCRYCKTRIALLNCGLVLNNQQAAAASFQTSICPLLLKCSSTALYLNRPWTLPSPRPRWYGDGREVDARRQRGQWGKAMPPSEEGDPWMGCYHWCFSPI